MTAWEEAGVLDDWLRQRAARPWEYLRDGIVYDEVAHHNEHPDGGGDGHYSIVARAIDPEEIPELESPRVGVTAALQAEVDSVADDELVSVMIQTDVDRPTRLPLLPPKASVSASDYALALDEREELSAYNADQYAANTAALEAAIVEAGGELATRHWTIGWIGAALPADAVAAIAERAEVVQITPRGYGEDGACTDLGEPDGDPVDLSQLREFTRVQDFTDAGYHGQPALHQEILVGIHEFSGLEDEACFLADYDDCDTSDRLRKKFNCTSGTCIQTNNFSDANEGRHGTNVASILFGDYRQDQGDDYENQIAPGLPAGWRDRASGFGREVEAHYYMVGGDEVDQVAGYACSHGVGAGCKGMDVVSSTNPVDTGICDAASHLAIEDAIEVAYDEGVLPVVITHNQNAYYVGGSDQCKVRSPADLPKALAVGALEPDDGLAYDEWRYAGYSNRGGGDIQVGFVTFSEAMSMVDLVASGFPGHVTDEDAPEEDAPYGIVDPDGPCVDDPPLNPVGDAGTSYAGPQVAGAAALVKHWALSKGWNWIDNPGRLLAVMLSMGDRATNTDAGAAGPTEPLCVFGDRIRCGTDFYYGLGRLRLHFVKRQSHWTWNFTSSTSNKTKLLFGGATLGTNVAMVKCVMQQREDMVTPNKNDISRISLTLRVRAPDPVLGCTAGVGQVYLSRTDNSYDDKHMVALLDSEVNLTGRCVEISWDKLTVSSAGSVSTHTFCYSDNELDY